MNYTFKEIVTVNYKELEKALRKRKEFRKCSLKIHFEEMYNPLDLIMFDPHSELEETEFWFFDNDYEAKLHNTICEVLQALPGDNKYVLIDFSDN